MNMNVMQPLYNAVENNPAYRDMDKNQILGFSLLIGEYETSVLLKPRMLLLLRCVEETNTSIVSFFK